ncbi:MAG: ATP-binding protein [Myxococcota bacterium]|nr:ATP-binding protein [Myxococcota bacterium]
MRLEGFAVGVFEAADVIETAMGSADHEIAVQVDDITDPNAVTALYQSEAAAATRPIASGQRLEYRDTLRHGGRTWEMRFAPAPGAPVRHGTPVPWAALLGGLAAGGIAHDFNNLLTSILGNSDLALTELSRESPGRDEIRQVRLAATRAADLTRQMLVYSGTRALATVVLDLSRLVDEMVHLLEASISKRAELRCEFAAQPVWIEGDPTQIRQIVMNLITNASDALGEGAGQIAIRTGERHFDAEALSTAYVDETPGPGVLAFLEVTDTGCGMSPSERLRVFDPFFTTKFQGRGLGLAAVLGIVRSHRGAIWVDSDVAEGSSFLVVFPVAEHDARGADAAIETREGAWRGAGTVLVVDDEEAIRRLATRVLGRLGFQVRTAVDGAEAVASFRQHGDEIAAVLLTRPCRG